MYGWTHGPKEWQFTPYSLSLSISMMTLCSLILFPTTLIKTYKLCFANVQITKRGNDNRLDEGHQSLYAFHELFSFTNILNIFPSPKALTMGLFNKEL